MAQLFGLDIAQIVDDSIQQAGGVLNGTLTKYAPGTRTPGNLSGGTNPAPTDYPFRGFLENRSESRINGTLVRAAGEFVSILGASLPAGIEPETTDEVTIEGTTYRVLEITERDPAAALYMLRVER
jgi:hypothetical protein